MLNPSVPFLALCAVLIFKSALPLSAQTNLYWDTNQSLPGLGNAGGVTTWSTGIQTNWNDATGTGTPVAWSNNNNAIFTGIPGTVSLGSDVAPIAMNVDVTGYTFTTSNADNNISGSVLNLAAAVNATFTSTSNGGFLHSFGDIEGALGSALTLSGSANANPNNANIINLTAANTTVSGFSVTAAGTGAGSTGFRSSASGVILDVAITNNSATSRTNLGATSGNTLTYAGSISGTAGLQISANGVGSGSGLVTVTNVNTFTGDTVLAGGNGSRLQVAVTGALQSTSSIVVNSGNTLIFSGSGNLNRINDSAPITLAGGSLSQANGGTGSSAISEGSGRSRNGATFSGASSVGLGALTLTAASQFSFGTSGAGTFSFAGFNPGGYVLNILNWTSSAFAPANISGIDGQDDRLIFAGDQSANLAFFSFNGTPATQIDLGDGFFEIAPVPEPGTWAAGILAVTALGWTQRKRLSGLRKKKSSDLATRVA